MSTDDILSAPSPDLFTIIAKTLFGVAWRLLLILFVPYALFGLFLLLCISSVGSENTDGPAPEASYAIRRQWGEEKLQHHFKAAEKWIYKSSQIAKDVGRVNRVAPIGSPNSFSASFGESEADMNLQVIGDKGEGVLCLPDFCADDPRNIYGFDRGSWIFDERKYPIFKNGKSRLESLGANSLFDQILGFAEQEDHDSVVMTCRLLERLLMNERNRPSKMFSGLAHSNRFKLLTQYAESLAETSNEEEATKMYVQAAALELTQLLKLQKAYRETKPKKEQIQLDLKRANAALRKAQALEPNNQSVLKLASWRTLFTYQNQCGSMLFESEDLNSDKRQQLIRRELKGMFEYAEQLAKKSPYLRSVLGAITTRPKVGYTGVPEATRIHWSNLPIELVEAIGTNICEDYSTLRINPVTGGYQSYIGIAIKGAKGKTGTLTVFVQENNSPESRLDLFSETPRGPSDSNLTASIIRWREDGKRYVSLSSTTLDLKKKK